MYLQTNTINKFLIDTLRDEDEDGWIEDFSSNDQLISVQDSLSAFERYCLKMKFVDNKNIKYFSKLMISMLGDKASTKKRIDGKEHRMYRFKINELKDKLRNHFKNDNLFN